MSRPRRLFDCIEEQLKNGSHDAALVGKEGGQWRKYSTAEIKDTVDKLAAGLLALGISGNDMSLEGRDKIALLSKNRPEWVLLDLAVQQVGAVLVPIYPTVHPTDLEFVLNDAQVKLVFVNDDDLFAKVQGIKSRLSTVQDIYSFERVEGARHWAEILPLGKQKQFEQLAEIADKINTEDLFTIIYTSGTTGTPKGVMLSHHNVLSNVMSAMPSFNLGRHKRSLSFLPLNHVFERVATYLYLFSGTSIYYAESMDTLGENLREVKPHMFTTVPRLLEKVYERILSKAREQSNLKQKIFGWSLHLGGQYDVHGKKSLWYRLQLALAGKIVFKKWREALGGEVECIVTGAAACPVKLIRLFTAAGIPILEGYGLTESSPVISFNRPDAKQRMFGTVGTVIDGVEVRIAEDGEILCKGPNVMMGYYKRPDLTEEAIQDGWLHTGDIGVLINNKFLKITDRKKEIFKTSGGKYVAPQPIENKLVESPLIEQVMVVGAGKKFAGALIVPSFQRVREWCSKNGLKGTTNEELICRPEVVGLIKETVDKLNKNFSQVEQIKKFELLGREWTIEGGELTPTLKLKRKVIMDKYKEEIEKIFD
ncbi:long-chain fatty acid--CoA ligase [Paraflavisolibacter sp. H34]|uniref:AMP-dependent synthetase/ligase n=1 Tax=Huijunlia imazamoxiresistens TaxID=3127457 RepID=UPI00301B3D7C